MNNQLEEAPKQTPQLWHRQNNDIETLLASLPTRRLRKPTSRTTPQSAYTSNIKKTKDKYEYYIWKGNRGLEIPKIVYDSLDLPEEIVDNRFNYRTNPPGPRRKVIRNLHKIFKGQQSVMIDSPTT